MSIQENSYAAISGGLVRGGVAEYVGSQQFKKLTACVRDAISPPLAYRWRFDFADFGNPYGATERINNLGVIHVR